MKTTTPELALHMAQENTTLARLLKIVRLDGTILRFTDFDADLFYKDTSTPFVAKWLPNVAEISPWWVPTNDSFSVSTFAGDTGQSHIFSVAAGDTGFPNASQIFAGDSSVGNAHFLGTTAFSKGFTFETYIGLQANNLAATGGLVTGVSTGSAWVGGPDKYIGFEGSKTAGNAWGNWKLRMSDGVTTTVVDTGVPIFNAILSSWNAPRVKLKFIVNAAGSL